MSDADDSRLGRRFPTAVGTALSGEVIRFPHDLAGGPAVLFVAYRRGTQDDIDRWAAFLRREAPELTVYELPVIPSLLWRPLQGWIDGGMRAGVTRSEWSRVVTLYATGSVIRDFVGDNGALAANVVLLDGEGSVRWVHDKGFEEAAGRRLLATVAGLPPAP